MNITFQVQPEPSRVSSSTVAAAVATAAARVRAFKAAPKRAPSPASSRFKSRDERLARFKLRRELEAKQSVRHWRAAFKPVNGNSSMMDPESFLDEVSILMHTADDLDASMRRGDADTRRELPGLSSYAPVLPEGEEGHARILPHDVTQEHAKGV